MIKSFRTVITLGAALPLGLSACATTARMHEQSELNSIGQRCGLALGELFQDEAEKKLLFMMRPGSTAAQKSCVAKWARKNGLKAVFVDNIEFPVG